MPQEGRYLYCTQVLCQDCSIHVHCCVNRWQPVKVMLRPHKAPHVASALRESRSRQASCCTYTMLAFASPTTFSHTNASCTPPACPGKGADASLAGQRPALPQSQSQEHRRFSLSLGCNHAHVLPALLTQQERPVYLPCAFSMAHQDLVRQVTSQAPHYAASACQPTRPHTCVGQVS